MPGSLKAYATLLAWRLSTTPAALYERQRALVRDGILQLPEGRGPGSGVQAGPYEVALLLLAVLATDSLSETGDKVRILANAKSIADHGCPLTGESTFVEAVARVLDMTPEQWRNIRGITVDRTTATGRIDYEAKFSSGGSLFVGRKQSEVGLWSPTRLRVNATLTRDLIIDIATDLKKAADSEQRARAAALQPTGNSERRVGAQGRKRNVKRRRPKKAGEKT